MKNRILSLLLLVAMIVTAIPMVAFPITAAETEAEAEFDVADYNALYVQDSAIYLLDFFTLNSYWGGTVDDSAIPPAENSNYYYAKGKTSHDFTVVENRLADDTKYILMRIVPGDNSTWEYYDSGSLFVGSTATPNRGNAAVTYADKDAALAAALEKAGEGATALGADAGREGYLATDGYVYYVAAKKIDAHAAFKQAQSDFQSAFKLKVLGSLTHAPIDSNQPHLTHFFPTMGIQTWHTASGNAMVPAYKIGNGYITMDTMMSDQYLSLTAIPKEGGLYLETTVASGDANATNVPFIVFRDIRMGFTVNNDGMTVGAETVAYNGLVKTPLAATPVVAGRNNLFSLTFFSNRTVDPKGSYVVAYKTTGNPLGVFQKDSTWGFNKEPVLYATKEEALLAAYRLAGHSDATSYPAGETQWTNGKNTYLVVADYQAATQSGVTVTMDGVTLIDNATLRDYPANVHAANELDQRNCNGLISYSSTVLKPRVYSYRVYGKDLTAAEKAQNHFADLMKWYKIDLTRFNMLNADEIDANFYAAFAGFEIDNADSRDDIIAALNAAVVSALAKRYTGINEAYVALAVQYGLDLSPLMSQPKGMLANTIAFLNGGYKTSTDVKADYQAALDADLVSDMTAEEYNALYVTNGLKIAIDYFASNTHWGEAPKAANDPSYLRLWEVSKTTTLASRGTVENGYLLANKDSEFSYTNLASANGVNGVTIEYVFMDDHAGAGTILNIDDMRIASTLVGTTQTITEFAQRSVNGVLRLPAATEGGEYGRLTGLSKSFTWTRTAQTFALSMVHPESTVDYYYFFGYKNDANLVQPTATQVKSFNPASSTYFYVTHTLNKDTGELTLVDHELTNTSTEKMLFAFFKPVYHTADDGKVYIVGSTDRRNNSGIGLGIGNDQRDPEDIGPENFYTAPTGSVALYRNGEELYSFDNVMWPNNSGIYNGGYLRYGYSYKDGGTTIYPERYVYAYRTYNRVLSEYELAQNHFADIAKYFRLNLSGLAALIAANDTEALAAVYASVAALDVATATRTEAQSAVSAVLNGYVDTAYEAMKTGDPTIDAFIDLACDYRLDVSAVLASARDVSSVYAITVDGLTCSAAQDVLDDAFLDAYYYLAYLLDPIEEDAVLFNSMLTGLAAKTKPGDKARVDLEGLMALPISARGGILEHVDEILASDVTVAQAIVDEVVSEAMLIFNGSTVDYDYDSLYVQDGLAISLDFFSANRYWNAPKSLAPVGPTNDSAYRYDANGDGEVAEDEVFDLTGKDRTSFRLVIKYTDANGKVTYSFYEDNGESYKSVPYINNATLEFATKAEAEAKLADAQARVDAAEGKAAGTYEVIVEERASIAFNHAFEAWKKADMAFYKAYVNNEKPSYYFFTYQSNLQAGRTDLKDMMDSTFTILELGDGYATLDPNSKFFSSGGLQWSLNTSASPSDDLSVTFVGQMGNKVTNDFLLFQNVRYQVAQDSLGNVAISGTTTAMKSTATDLVYFDPNATQDLTFTLKGALTEGGDEDSTAVRAPGKTLYSADASYTGAFNRTNYFGWGDSMEGGKIYAIRIYHSELTDAEILQNHFADVAKFYRLDLSMFPLLTEAQKLDVYAAFADFTLDDGSTRDEVQATFLTAASVYYDGITIIESDADANAAFIYLAAFAALDLSPIENLAVDEREALAYAMIETFDFDYAVSAAVVSYIYKRVTEQFSFLTFAGYQARLTSGSSIADYAGVRAVFDIDAEAIYYYLTDAAESGFTYSVVLEAYVMVEGEVKDTLTFTAELVDGDLHIYSEDEDIAYLRTNAAGEETVSFNYTVTYKGEDLTKELLEEEFSYAYSITVVDDADYSDAYNFNVNSKTFGDTVSGAEIYTYFAGTDYANDPVVKSVIDTIAE